MKKLLFLSPIFVLVFSCSGEKEIEKEPIFSCVIGGHIYGHPDRYTSSVYPNFLHQLDSLKQKDQLDLLILTGDVVAHPTEENWNTVKSELDNLNTEWIIAPGNHDISLYMDQHIQDFKYKTLVRENNLFMTLNTSHPGWTPDSLQQIFIKESLEGIDSLDNVFVFTHQVWWQKNPPEAFKIDSVRPNSYAGYDGETSFWDDAFPFFEDIDKEIHFFAGDMGCYEGLTAYYEHHHENYHFYGSGMGGGLEDNFLIIQVFQDGIVEIQKVDF